MIVLTAQSDFIHKGSEEEVCSSSKPLLEYMAAAVLQEKGLIPLDFFTMLEAFKRKFRNPANRRFLGKTRGPGIRQPEY